MSDNAVKYKHAARTALLPMVTFAAFSFSIVIGESIYIETIFSYPGIGLLTYNAINSRDYPVLQGCFFIFCIVVILMNLLVDLFYMYLDPGSGIRQMKKTLSNIGQFWKVYRQRKTAVVGLVDCTRLCSSDRFRTVLRPALSNSKFGFN